MKKYRLVSATLIFYNGKKITLSLESKILSYPIKVAEELFLDGLKNSGMKEPPVKCKLKVEYV